MTGENGDEEAGGGVLVAATSPRQPYLERDAAAGATGVASTAAVGVEEEQTGLR